MRTIDSETYHLNTARYELRSGQTQDAPNCPFGNKYEWIGYDLEQREFVRFTKSVFKKLIEEKKDNSHSFDYKN